MYSKLTNRQWLGLMIAGVVLTIGLIFGGCALMGAAFRLWGLL